MAASRSRGETLCLGSELPPGWDDVAALTPSPFLTQAWLDAWWNSRGKGERVVATIVGTDGELLAGASLARRRFGVLSATADEHSGDWDVVAVDNRARDTLLRELAGFDSAVVSVGPLRSSQLVREAFVRSGRRTREVSGPRSPYLPLGGSFEDLLAARSSNLRSQFRRRRRALERRGELRLRTTAGGAGLDTDVDAVLRLEASGWKARRGTSIVSRPDTERLYREFSHAAAAKGWLRLYLLELDGVPIAGDLGCTMGGEGFLIKTGFDEAFSQASPGLVLRGEVLSACIAEGMRGYDFLGGPDHYKLRWTDDLRPRTSLRGYRGLTSAPSEAWHHALRPALAHARRRARVYRDKSR